MAQGEGRRKGQFVICGVVVARDDLYALLVGERDGPALRFCGVVEYGVGRRLVAALLEHAPTRDASPFAGLSRWTGAT